MYYSNKLLFFYIASYFTIISCKNDKSYNDNLNLEEFSVSFASTPYSLTSFTATGKIVCDKYNSSFTITQNNANIDIAKNTACEITFSSIEFITTDNQKYKFNNTLISITLDAQHKQIERKLNTSYKNSVTDKEYSVFTLININKKELTINFTENAAEQHLKKETIKSYTLNPVKVNVSVVESPPKITLNMTSLRYENGSETNTHYHLNVTTKDEEPDADKCFIVSEKEYNEHIKTKENIKEYVAKTKATTRTSCPKFYEEEKNKNYGNWDNYANSTYYIIISTHPIEEEYNNYAYVKIDKAD